tara:strand:- start:697 stop:1395 length:699 start_codon:yes stop_codon:yes gene_type:complete
MNFESELLSGTFIKRYKRFFVDVNLNNRIVTAHCPNTGSMMGLLKEGNKVWISKSKNPDRKLKYTLEIIEVGKNKVGVNTHFTNKILFEGLNDNYINIFGKTKIIKPEKKFGKDTRFDFYIENGKIKSFIEVKNVTLLRKSRVAEFPDAKTSRGLKHLKSLIEANKQGYQIYLIFVIQREKCNKFQIAKDIDPAYANLLTEAIKSNLKVICYDCKFSSKGIKLNKRIKFENE